MGEINDADAAEWRRRAERDQRDTREHRVEAFIEDNGDVDLDDDEFEDAVYELGLREVDEGWLTANYELVIQGVEKLESVGLTDVSHHVSMAASMIMLGRFQDALDAALECLSGDPEDVADLQCLAVLCLYRLGRDAEALAHVDEYLEMSADNPLLWQLKSRILGRLGQDEEALVCRDRAREMIGSNPSRTWALRSTRAAAAGNRVGAEVYRHLTLLITDVGQGA